ncbi:MAG: saccharopine dehydrogenase NADP-binding domain-containing protein [Acidobacteriaceae bacterium]
MSEHAALKRELSVAVLGAAGHTGRFMVRELLRRGITPIAVTRNSAALTAAFPGERGILCREASIENAERLAHALDGAAAVINCVGPFFETADVVAGAALRLGIHYLDVSAEQPSARDLLDKYDAAAREAGIVIVPSMAFYGGFADLLATAALKDWQQADAIEVVIGLDSWHPTRGTRLTGAKNTTQRMVIAEGRLTPVPSPRAQMDWEFGNPLGRQTLVETPFSEIVLISHHVQTAELHTWLSRIALDELRDPNTPEPKAADETGRSSQRFVVDVVAKRGGEVRRVRAQGRDIYAFSATLLCEGLEHLLRGNWRSLGAQPPGVAFDVNAILSRLPLDSLTSTQ